MENFENFGGKNKARRLAKAVKKGKTEKAEKLAKKVASKVQKLIDKGKTSKKRYEFLTNRLKDAGEAQMSILELEEVEAITDEATADNEAEFEKEIKDAEEDAPDGTEAKGVDATDELQEKKQFIPKIPNWVTIVVGSVVALGILTGILIYTKKE